MTPQYPEGNVFYRNLFFPYSCISRGRGAYLYDEKGKKYLDASGGAAVVNLGHGVKELSKALSQQAQKVGYVNGMQFSHVPAEELASLISVFLPFDKGKAFFLTSGSEAIEAALKLARQYWVSLGNERKTHVISRFPSYHGNTAAALSISAREHYKKIFRPLLRENVKIPAPYCYRCFWKEEYPSCQIKCAFQLEKVIENLGNESVSAFVTEVIGGSSTGAAVPPPEYFQIVREICNKHHVLLIADEVMTGIGRTGKWLASLHYGLVPDIIVLGKGLTSGYFPLSAVCAPGKLIEPLYKKKQSFLHAQTFSHHPVGCAVGSATIRFIREKNLLEECKKNGTDLLDILGGLLSHPHVGDVRGKGLLIGVEFVKNRSRKEPFPRKKRYVEKFLSLALQKGLILWPNSGHADGINGDLVMIAPPFLIAAKEQSRIFSVMKDVLQEMEKSL